jgi:ribonuclease HI
VKINVDAAYSEEEGWCSTGAIIKDYLGNFIAAQNKDLPFIADAMTAEAYALREGLCLAQQMEWNRLIIQSDNKSVVDTLNDGGFSENDAAVVFFDCNILASWFSKVSYEYCPREANSVAHELAKFSFQTISSCT